MSHRRDEALADALYLFLNARTWEDTKRIVEEHEDVLLTGTADEVLANLLTQYREDENTTRTRERQRALLARCRREGTDAAFTWHDELSSLLRELSRQITPDEMPRRIAVCQDALTLTDRNDTPLLWAWLHERLTYSLLSNPQEHVAENLERAIFHCDQALEVYTRDDFPVDWARTQRNLSIAYAERIQRDRAENLERAIFHCDQALEVYTREGFPVDWAATQHNLANVYSRRIREDRAENLKRAIFHYGQALEVYTRDDFPVDWARTQRNLVTAHSDLIREDKAENPEEAIARYKLALEIVTQEDYPVEWAGIHNVLARTYRERGREDRAQNIEKAIYHYRQSLRVFTQKGFPLQWAATQNVLATAYRERLLEDRTENVEEAIRRYKLALKVYTREDVPGVWAGIQDALATVYSGRSRGDRAENVEKAIYHYAQALKVRTREDSPVEWARNQRNLAYEYQVRIREDRAENVEKAIYHCRQALEVFTQKDFPLQWAATQNVLAAAYRERIREDRAENVEKAIYHYEQALEVFTQENYQVERGKTQDGLASAYVKRIWGDRTENLEKAISRFEQSLEVHTREDSPTEWAAIQNNLAIAYSERAREDQAQNIEKAIYHYEQALEVFTRDDDPAAWSTAQNNLGLTYRNRIREDKAQNLEEAISCFKRALEVRSRENLPVDWAVTQGNLAIAYSERIRGDRAENVEKAIYHYGQALEVFTRDDDPVEWARIQHNLAIAYSERIWGDKRLNIEQAIYHYGQALEVHKPNTLPQNCRDTANNLSLLLHTKNRFAEARIVLETAHKAVEALRGEVQREEARRELAKGNANLYARLVHCCLIEGDEEAAFHYAVAGKGRAFVDMLATARLDLSAAGADDPQLAGDLRHARKLRQQIDNLLAQLNREGGVSLEEDGEERGAILVQMQVELDALQKQEDNHWREMSFRYPALTATREAPTLSAEEARTLARELEATLVEYYRHAGGWCAFVVSPGGAHEVQHVPLPGVDENRKKILGWLEDVESSNWNNKWSLLSLRSLHKAVIAPLSDHLPAGGAVVIAPFSWLHLVPLNAALDPATERYATDDYLLGLTPNLAALRVTLDQQARQDHAEEEEAYANLLGVAYPGTPGSDDYLYSVMPETNAVAWHFAPRVTVLPEEKATPQAVLSNARGKDVVHFGCHGDFNPAAPRQSGLMLSGGTRTADPRWLTVQQIITQLHLEQTKLATIGACLSGRVAVREGEEHVGLVQAMMSAKARTVVASLWSVNDTSTRALFEAFYASIKAGSSPAAALAEAARGVREHEGWEHPYYWAAFQPIGLALEGDDTGPARFSDEVTSRQEDAYEERNESERGGAKMGKNQMVEDSITRLRQMKRHPDELRTILDEAGERQSVAEKLRDLEEQASNVQTEEKLLEVADGIHRLVEDTDALAGVLMPKGLDVEAERQQRSVTMKTFQKSPRASWVDRYKDYILNDLVRLRWEVEHSPDEDSPEKEESGD